MCTVFKITFIVLSFLGLGASSEESGVPEQSVSNYTDVSHTITRRHFKNNTFLYYDEQRNDSNRLFINNIMLHRKDIFILYNTLSRLTHTDDVDGIVKDNEHKFVINGYYVAGYKIYFSVLMTENKAKSIQNKIRKEVSKDNSTLYSNYLYTISPRIVLDFNYMRFVQSYEKIFIITLQEYNRIIHYGPYLMISYLCILFLSILITIPGSIIICAFILKYKHLQTPPNVYVFNLAATDILLVASQIYLTLSAFSSDPDAGDSIEIWLVTDYFIPSFWKIVCWTAAGVTVDRYITICHPFLGGRISTYSRAVKINVIIWAISLTITMIELGVKKIYLNDHGAPDLEIRYNLYYDMYLLTLLIILPVCIILPAYVCISLRLWKLSKTTTEQPLTKNSIKLAVVIAVQFIFCWAPMAGSDFLLKLINASNSEMLYILIEYVGLGLFLLGSMLNPFMFALVSVHFRKAFKDLGSSCIDCIRRRLCCGKRTPHVDSNIALNEY